VEQDNNTETGEGGNFIFILGFDNLVGDCS